MSQVAEQDILATLKGVKEPDSGRDIVTLGMISGLVVKDGNVGFAIEVDPRKGAAMEPLRKAAEEVVNALPGVLSVTAVLTAHSKAPGAQPNAAAGGPPASVRQAAGPVRTPKNARTGTTGSAYPVPYQSPARPRHVQHGWHQAHGAVQADGNRRAGGSPAYRGA